MLFMIVTFLCVTLTMSIDRTLLTILFHFNSDVNLIYFKVNLNFDFDSSLNLKIQRVIPVPKICIISTAQAAFMSWFS